VVRSDGVLEGSYGLVHEPGEPGEYRPPASSPCYPQDVDVIDDCARPTAGSS
jgi:hypothetical protein